MQPFADLKVWQRSHALVLELYGISTAFPADERFGLVSQLRRAAVSVPSNIVEGSKRRHGKDYARFLNVAEGSAAEVQYLIILSRDLGLLSDDRADAILAEIDEIARMLHALRKKVEHDA